MSKISQALKNRKTALHRAALARNRKRPVAGHGNGYWLARARYWGRRARSLKRAEQSGFHPAMLSGRPSNISRGAKEFVARAHRAGLLVSSTTSGGHAPSSYHYARNNSDGLGHAVDVYGPWDKMVRFQKAEARYPARFKELFGPDNNYNLKNGVRMSLPEGSALENLHDTHVHGALVR